ncbi:MAG: hypothetical protein M1828_006919 [Chrysothrix sp. TS-e1954]|nr:MAG: hypothetical protein M1828_006919 [Chrysothrix sp. TS-e1954]
MGMTSEARSQDHRKPCTLCQKPRDVLVRCQIDSTETWHFVCPGKCWKEVSGGVVDGDKTEIHEWYRYGGMWKNKHEAVSAKKPKKPKKAAKPLQEEQMTIAEADTTSVEPRGGVQSWDCGEKIYVRNDKVLWDGTLWKCRKTHWSEERKPPTKAYSLWKDVPHESAAAG